MEKSPKEKFQTELNNFIEVIDKIDKETPWSVVEPDWWVDMIEIRQLCHKVLSKHKSKS